MPISIELNKATSYANASLHVAVPQTRAGTIAYAEWCLRHHGCRNSLLAAIKREFAGTLKIHALVIIARVLVCVGAAAEDLSLVCRRRAGRILDEAAAWCDARDAAYWRARQE
jgi:hypothetical protein